MVTYNTFLTGCKSLSQPGVASDFKGQMKEHKKSQRQLFGQLLSFLVVSVLTPHESALHGLKL
jgi:hypothetical protein